MNNATPKKKYRTKNDITEPVAHVPDVVASPTLHMFRESTAFKDGDRRYLILIQRTKDNDVHYDPENRAFYHNGQVMDLMNLMSLVDTWENQLVDIDLWPLRVMYSIICKDLEEEFRKGALTDDQMRHYSVNVRIPDLLGALCSKGNVSKATAIELLKQHLMGNYKDVYGAVYITENGIVDDEPDFYQVLNVPVIKTKENTIRIESPYLNQLLLEIMRESVRVDAKGNPRLNNKGEPLRFPYNSYLIKTSIMKERSKRAAEIVRIVCATIEEAGSDNTPRISVRLILDRHAELDYYLKSTDNRTHKDRALKRAFTKAWELLEKHTRLTEVYKDIKIPDQLTYPTTATMDNMVLEFPHKGKR